VAVGGSLLVPDWTHAADAPLRSWSIRTSSHDRWDGCYRRTLATPTAEVFTSPTLQAGHSLRHSTGRNQTEPLATGQPGLPTRPARTALVRPHQPVRTYLL